MTMRRLSLCLCFLSVCLAAMPALAVDYAARGVKVQAPRIGATFGKKMTASGGATLTTKEMTLQASTVTWYFAPKGGQIEKLEAEGNVRFHLVQTDAQGTKVTADGESDFLVYVVADKKATISSPAKGTKKAHVHAVETTPPPQAGAAPAEPNIYDIRAYDINFNLAERTLEAVGEVELDTTLPEGAAAKAAK